MSFKFVPFCVFLFIFCTSNAQKTVVSGTVFDAGSNEILIGTIIYSPKTNTNVQTNSSGYFSFIEDSKDSVFELIVYSPGYEKVTLSIHSKSDTTVNIFLKSVSFKQFDEVKVTAERIKKPELGLIELPIKLLKQLPTIGGEPDVIKAFQLMPGVAGGKEGTSGLYVRGGSPDQNLFLLDEIPLYYVSHIGGFVSTFDPNAINSIKLYKGNFPARYSGRLSSVIDIRMKDGNAKKRTGEVFVGLLSTKFQIEGPLKKDSSITYFFSARRFNIDLFTRLIARIATDGESAAGYTFYDLNGKLVKRFENNSKLSLTMYDGRDRIFVNASQKRDEFSSNAFKYKSNVKWGNLMGTLNYSYPISKKLFSNFTLASTNFFYITDVKAKYSDQGSDELTNESQLTFKSGVNDIILKSQFDYTVNDKTQLIFGAKSNFHIFTPGRIESQGISNKDTIVNNKKINALENTVFIENHIKISKKILVNLGLNGTSFLLQDTNFFSFEPRFSFNYNFAKNFTVQGGYSRMKQFMHYLSNSGAGLPSDLWIPVTRKLVPEISNQFSLGFTVTTSKSKKLPLAISIEGFYKNLENLIDYKEGTNLFQADAIENKIVKDGIGEVYGIEFLIQKTIGKSTGWISYTLSKNTRTFADLNGGKTFPYKFDRRHDISLVFTHSFTEKIQFTATWVFSTGNAITLAQGKYNQIDLGQYYYQDPSVDPSTYVLNEAQLYNGKNSYRMPSYHKLDVGMSFQKTKPKGIRTFSFGIYNVYNQQNPFFLFYKKNKQNEIKLYQLTLFPIIPSVNYSFAF
jgi:hypothetical protein